MRVKKDNPGDSFPAADDPQVPLRELVQASNVHSVAGEVVRGVLCARDVLCKPGANIFCNRAVSCKPSSTFQE